MQADPLTTWPSRLAKAREEQGLTQAELARRVHDATNGAIRLDQRSVSNYERGVTSPSANAQAWIARTLGLPVRALFPRDDEEARADW